MADYSYTPVAPVRLTIAATGATGSSAAPGEARAVIVSVQTAAAYVTFDGTIPGGTTGHYMPTGLQPQFYPVAPGARITAVSTLGSTGTALDITWLT